MVVRMKVDYNHIRRQLRRLEPEAKREVQASVVAGAEMVAARQRQMVRRVSGDLYDSIDVTKPGETTPPHSQPGGARQAGEFEAIVTAGNSGVRYAHLVEFGTQPHKAGGIFEGLEHPGANAQPFFWPGYRLVRKPVRAMVKRSIRRAIKRAWKG
ncbi:phage protein, HK97, GP10 [Stappia sp. 22II-S9-Z10]|nr:phage protein, HK97, GP10 [Stappia sp. 22II-S9-Z10]